MKAKWLVRFAILAAVLCALRVSAEVNKTIRPDAPDRPFVFVENNADNNFFVTPGGALDPRITGANRWTGLKYNGSGTIYQQSLGYIDNGYNTPLRANWQFDMWLENSPASYPLLGLRCINWYSGCDMTTSLIQPQIIDANGFYGATVTSGGQKWMHGMMSDSFYQYLQSMPVGGSFSMVINTCMTSISYDASSGERCKDQNSGNWYVRNVTHTKAAHLRLMNTNALAEVFINTDGVPTMGEGSADCQTQTIGSRTGLACKMVNYNLQTDGLDASSIHIFPSLNHASLSSAIGSYDMQFSLDGNSWKRVSGTTYYYSFNDMKAANSIYIFLSSNFFKQMVALGISDINTKDLFNFRFNNTKSPESGWYEFSSSNTLIIKPRDFSVSIISDEYTTVPTHEGHVGNDQPSLDFGYVVTTSGKTAADEVLIKVTGPAQTIGGRSYCIFSSPDGASRVPFPATLAFTAQDGAIKTYDAGCDDNWHDITNALWLHTPWDNISGETGVMNKTTVKFSIAMDNAISLQTVEQTGWFGEVSTSGEIHVRATWRNIN
ncbi:CFA/I fimbrial minor adhesin [Paramixta manurensis]|uniref:CFA/I fimbrial minor adhesin n=1 Tax=Paramixta manurensis TaxID=2740817 RepID=A0A6M8UIV1_9GAMM|nr:CFA/I fimbrial minor adhesin [Erwiniaceae bacterium PD-1]